MPNSDKLQRFLFNDADVRGEHIILDKAINDILALYPYPEAIANILSQSLTAVSLITAMLKFEGKISLQLQHGHELPLLFAEANHQGQIRGLAQWKPNSTFSSFKKLVEGGVLTVNLMPKNGQQYQGVIALESRNLATCLEQYFLQSEQLETKLWLFNHQNKYAGLMLQQLPEKKPQKEAFNRTTIWQELIILSETIKAQEITQQSCQQLLKLLYTEHNIQLFESTNVSFNCSCSEQRALTSILMLSKTELNQLFKQQQFLESDCEFCRAHYQFSKHQVFQARLERENQHAN